MREFLEWLRAQLDPHYRPSRSAWQHQASESPQVRALEERIVFNAASMAMVQSSGSASTPGASSPSPAATIVVSQDSSGRFQIEDFSLSGQHSDLTLSYDSANQRLNLHSDSTFISNRLNGATGSDAHSLTLTMSQSQLESLVLRGGEGDNNFALNLADGVSQHIVVEGGGGTDTLSIDGQSFDAASYSMQTDGSVQMQLASGTTNTLVLAFDFAGVSDNTAALSRSVLIGGTSTVATLTSNDARVDVAVGGGTSLEFVNPTKLLSVTTAGDSSVLQITGAIDTKGADLQASAAVIDVSGTIDACGGTISLTAHIGLNVASEARLISTGGLIALNAGNSGTLNFAGEINVANADGFGGEVQLLGREVNLLGEASIDASGSTGGGRVYVGGGLRGEDTRFINATHVSVSALSSINASAIQNGNGGTIIVWADEQAIVLGSGNLHARGGINGGDGGLIETSGKEYLEIGEAADASASAGKAGTWLMDPRNVEIVEGGHASLHDGVLYPYKDWTRIDAYTIICALERGTNVVITTGHRGSAEGNIVVNQAIVLTGGRWDVCLTLEAANDIIVNEAIVSTSVSLDVNLHANKSQGYDPSPSRGDVKIHAPIKTNGGSFTATGVNYKSDAEICTDGGDIDLTFRGEVNIAAKIDADSGKVEIHTHDAVAFCDDGRVVAACVEIVAGRIESRADHVVIDTSRYDGDVKLETCDAIGSAHQPLQVDLGSGTLSLTTTGRYGDIYIGSPSSLKLGEVKTAYGEQTVAISADGDVHLVQSSDTDDAWSIVAGGDLQFCDEATLYASSVSVTAGGAIVGGHGWVDIDTSAFGGDISLTSNGPIGSSNNALAVEAGSGTVQLATNSRYGDIYICSPGSLNLGEVFTANGEQTVRVKAGDDLRIVESSDTDDAWTLVAGDDLVFSDDATLTAANVDAIAGGKIVGGSGYVDINTSALGGNISLRADGPIGSATNAIAVNAGAGGVSLATSGRYGDIFLSSPESLKLGEISTADGEQTVEIRAGGDLKLSESNGTDDAWTLVAGDDLVFSDDATLTAAKVDAIAGGKIVGGSGYVDIDTSTLGGEISLIADGPIGSRSNAISVSAGSGTVHLTTTGRYGDVYVASPGSLNLGRVTTANSEQTIRIEAGDDLRLVDSSNTDDAWSLIAADDIKFKDSSSLTASSAVLQAGGEIIGGTSRTDIDTSASGGEISLTAAGRIGSSGKSFSVNAGSGTVYLTTTGRYGDIYLTSPGSLNLGKVSTASGEKTIEIDAGGDLRIVESSTTDDAWSLRAQNDIEFASATLNAASANLEAGGKIIGGSGPVDIDTSAASGDIELTANNGIGSSSNAVAVNAGSGSLGLTTTGRYGDIYVSSQGDLNLGRVSTVSGEQTVDVRAGGDLNLVDSSETDDAWSLESLNDIAFIGSATLTASSATLIAGGEIVSGTNQTDIDTSASGGDISLTSEGRIGSGNNAFAVNADSGTVRLTTTSRYGDIYLSSQGDLNLGRVSTASGEQSVAIHATGDLNLVESSDTDDAWTLESSKDIQFVGSSTLTASSATLIAGGEIVSGTSQTDIDTSASGGDISLKADRPIGSANNAFSVNAGDGTVRGTTTGRYGDVFITSPGSLNVGEVSTASGEQSIDLVAAEVNLVESSDTDDAWSIRSQRNISFVGPVTLIAGSADLQAGGEMIGGINRADIDTSASGGDVSLTADGRIGSTSNALSVNAGDGTVRATTTGRYGDIYLDSPGLLNLGGVTTGAGEQTIDIRAASVLRLVESSRTDDAWSLESQGNIEFAGPVTLAAGSIVLQAGGEVTSGTSGVDVDTSARGGNISIVSVGRIGSADNALVAKAGEGTVRLTTTGRYGDIFITSPGELNLGKVATAQGEQTVAIGAEGDLRFVESSTTDDAWTLSADRNIEFAGPVTLTSASAGLDAGGEIIGGTNQADIDTSATGGDIALTTAGRIGSATNAIAVDAGTGTVRATTTGRYGDIFLGSPGSLNLGEVSTSLGEQTISIKSDGDLRIIESSATDDAWTLDARNNLQFSGSVTLTASKLTASAGGEMIGGTNPVDIATSGGDIDLVAGGRIGSSSNPFAVDAGTGTVRLATTSRLGDIFVTSPGSLNLGRVATANGEQTIDISAASEIRIVESSITDDAWKLAAQGNIEFATGSVTASQAELNAGGSVLSGTNAIDLDTSAAGGEVRITSGGPIGAAGNAVAVDAGSGTVRLATTTIYGDIYLTSSRSLNLGRVVTAGGEQTVQIDAGDTLTLVESSTTDDAWSLSADSDILFAGPVSLTASSAVLNSGREIIGGTNPVDIDTSAAGGKIALNALGQIGSVDNPFSVTAGTGVVTMSTIARRGDIYLSSPDTLNLGQVSTAIGEEIVTIRAGEDLRIVESSSTDDAWSLTANGDVAFVGPVTLNAGSAGVNSGREIISGTSVADIDTSADGGNITLTALGQIGTVDNPFAVNAGSGIVELTTIARRGEIYLTSPGVLNLGQVTTAAGQETVAISAAGDLRLTTSNSGDDAWSLTSAENIVFVGDSSLTAQEIRIAAGQNIIAGTDPVSLRSLGGAIDLVAGGAIGDSRIPLGVTGGRLTTSSGGDQHLSTPQSLVVGNLLSTTGTIYLHQGEFTLDQSLTGSLDVMPGVSLIGSGTIRGTFTLETGAKLNPGVGPRGIGTILVEGNATLAPGSELTLDLNYPYDKPGVNTDLLSVTGSLTLTNSILVVTGGERLPDVTNGATLIGLSPQSSIAIGKFAPGVGSVNSDGKLITGDTSIDINYRGGDGNDITVKRGIIINTAPPPPPSIDARLFGSLKRPPAPVVAIPPRVIVDRNLPVTLNQQTYEANDQNESPLTGERKLIVMRLTPIDDAGTLKEEPVVKLDPSWLKKLSTIVKSLPDDRYRLVMVMENGEQRRVMDVVVRDGKPYEPEDSTEEIVPDSKLEEEPSLDQAVPEQNSQPVDNSKKPDGAAIPIKKHPSTNRRVDADDFDRAAESIAKQGIRWNARMRSFR